MERELQPIRILIADDHPLIKEGFTNLLKKQTAIVIVGEAANGREVLQMVDEFSPHVVIMDIKMPLMDGVEACRLITQKHSAVHVISFSMFDEEELIIDMLEAGAKGYLLKNTGKEELFKAIKAVYEGGEYHCTEVKRRIFQLMRHGKLGVARQQNKEHFTPTEISIIKLLCKEQTSKGIADYLRLTRRTVEHYKERLQEKMGVNTSIGIIFYAWKHKLIKPEEVDQLS